MRVTGSGLGCPDWPLCDGRVIPVFERAPLVEFSHRVVASVVGLLSLSVAVLAWRRYRDGALGACAEPGGAIPSAGRGPAGRGRRLDRAILVGQADPSRTGAGGRGVHGRRRPGRMEGRRHGTKCMCPPADRSDRWPSYRSPACFSSSCRARTWSATARAPRAERGRCAGAASCPTARPYLIHMAHRYLTALVGLAIVGSAVVALRWAGRVPGLGLAAWLVVAALAGQVLLGAWTVWAGFTMEMRAAHLGGATLLWTAVVALATLHGLSKSPPRLVTAPGIRSHEPARQASLIAIARDTEGRPGGTIWPSPSRASSCCSCWLPWRACSWRPAVRPT